MCHKFLVKNNPGVRLELSFEPNVLFKAASMTCYFNFISAIVCYDIHIAFYIFVTLVLSKR